MSDDYIDTGDRVVVTDRVASPQHARATYPELVGKHGLVLTNDGWGRCEVQIDGETRIYTLWNGCDLERESVAD